MTGRSRGHITHPEVSQSTSGGSGCASSSDPQWTQELPTEPGFYWVIPVKGNLLSVAFVKRLSTGLLFNIGGAPWDEKFIPDYWWWPVQLPPPESRP